MRTSSLILSTFATLLALGCTPFNAGPLTFARADDIDEERGTIIAEDLEFEMEADATETPSDPEEPYVPPEMAEHFEFQAEVHRMLDIVVNSLYQHNDVFLRELISNASDALDKIRYLLLTEPDKYAIDSEEISAMPLEIKIDYNEEAKTLTIRDTGVGMTHDEMVENLGTVARSGTTKFIQALKDKGNNDETIAQIGQFGVGFYSAFLVANRITVASKNPLDPVQHVWESTNGAAEFVVYDDPRGNTLGRGTEITLHLKPDSLEYAQENVVMDLAKRYSEFVVHPISVRITETVQVEIEDDEDEFAEDKDKSEDDLEVSEDEDDNEEQEKLKQFKDVTTYKYEVVNGNQAIWTREKDTITDDEYQAFYKQLSGEYNNATAWTHFNAEGNINFKSILYLPMDPPMSYQMGDMEPPKGAMKLYVRKVLIGDDFDLLPRYLGFVRGMVDSDDLELNVNRETLQDSKVLQVIRKKVSRKALELIRQFAKDSDEEFEKALEESESDDDDDKKALKTNKYVEWYQKFHPNIKLGILEDTPNESKLVKLLRYETSKSDGKMIPLSDYIERMKEWQDDIYVLGCMSLDECKKSPFMEPFNEKDVEVVYMTEPIDEYLVKQLHSIEKKKLVQISSENVKLNDEDEDLIKRREKVYRKKFMPLTKWLKELFKNSVMRVQVARRPLGSVPAIVSSSQHSHSANMERIARAQALRYGQDPSAANALRIFEINPRHPLIVKLLDGCPPADAKEDDEPFVVAPEITESAWVLYDMALLNGGFSIDDVDAHNKRLINILQSTLSLDSLTLEPEISPPIEEDEPPEIETDHFDFSNINNGNGLPEGITEEQMSKIMMDINTKDDEEASNSDESSIGDSQTENAEQTIDTPEEDKQVPQENAEQASNEQANMADEL